MPVPDAPPPFVGPLVPGAAALPRLSALPPWANGGLPAFIREVAGAVVVVEGEAIYLATLPDTVRVGGRRLNLFIGRSLLDRMGPLGPPVWNDPSVIRSGGNVVHRVYTVGGAGF